MRAFDRYTVCGHPIAHSLSPYLHSQFAKQVGEHVFYDKSSVPISGFATFLKQFARARGAGLSVTAPFKKEAFGLMHECTVEALKAQSVNAIRIDNENHWVGHNTDGNGFIADLNHRGLTDLTNISVLLLGAGGAASSICAGLIANGVASLHIANRTEEHAQKLLQFCSPTIGSSSSLDAIPPISFDLIINASSQGECVIAPSWQPAIWYDLSYSASHFTTQATQLNVKRYYNGLGLLIEQAALAFEFWRGIKPSTDALRHQFC